MKYKNDRHRLTEYDPENQTATCSICGPSTKIQIKHKGKSIRCRIAHRINLSKHNRKRYENGKALRLKAGGCTICGYSKCMNALSFHHVDPSEKKISIGQRIELPLRKSVILEISKCVIVCANCHHEIHAGVIPNEVIASLPRATIPQEYLVGRLPNGV